MSATAIAKIDAIRPYKTGNDVLWMRHKLNNIDKHRLLLAVGSRYGGTDVVSHMRQSRNAIAVALRRREHCNQKRRGPSALLSG
jgi:hypothetical protein